MIINDQLDIKLEQFMKEELNAVLKKKINKTPKLHSLTKYSLKFRRQENKL